MSNTLNISQQRTCRGTLVALVVLVIFGAAGGSCVQLELTDSTGAPRFVPAIGTMYELKRDFLVRSVKPEVGEAASYAYLLAKPAVYIPKYDPRSRRYDPQGKPGYVTRFETDLGILPVGTRFTISGALSREAPFSQMYYLIVLEGSSGRLVGELPVRLGERRGEEVYLTQDAKGRAPVPNGEFFRLVAEIDK